MIFSLMKSGFSLKGRRDKKNLARKLFFWKEKLGW